MDDDDFDLEPARGRRYPGGFHRRGVCRRCGCTEWRACVDRVPLLFFVEGPVGCHWANERATLCSVCRDQPRRRRFRWPRRRSAIQPPLDWREERELWQELLDDQELEACPVCQAVLQWERCWSCDGEGFDGHDCGEDVCCCLEPEDNERCEVCEGRGGWLTCPALPHKEAAA